MLKVECVDKEKRRSLDMLGINWMGTILDMERVKGIEPSYEAWEAAVLPLNYTRMISKCLLLLIASTLFIELNSQDF